MGWRLLQHSTSALYLALIYADVSSPVTHPFIRILSNRLAQGLLSSRPWSWHPISGGGGQHWALCVSFKSSSAPGHRYHAPAAVAPQLASRHGAVSYQWPHRLPVTGKQFSIELWLYLAQDGLCKGKKEFFFFFFFCKECFLLWLENMYHQVQSIFGPSWVWHLNNRFNISTAFQQVPLSTQIFSTFKSKAEGIQVKSLLPSGDQN